MRLLQHLIGERRMAYVFLLPNLAFFSLFVFVPLAIDLVYSFTGGESLFPSQRPYVGTDQYAYLFIPHRAGSIIFGAALPIRCASPSSSWYRW
jgi:ABC-type sugar transport system permease subunit